jgi:hemolysin activation/secretion protein
MLKIIRVLILLVFCLFFLPKFVFGEGEILDADIKRAIEAQDEFIIKEQNRLKLDQELLDTTIKTKALPKVDFEEMKLPEKMDGSLPSFNITKIEFEGVKSLDLFVQNRLKKNYVRRGLTINEINMLVRDLTNIYINKGYVTTRVYIPKQNLSLGTLKLSIQEGFIEDIVIQDCVVDIVLNESKGTEINTAFPGLIGKTLNIRDIEQGLDQINRLQVNNAEIKLVPSEKTMGATKVVIKNKPSTQGNANIRYDTLSEPKVQLIPNAFDVSYANLFHLNERLALNYSQKFKDNQQFNNSISLDFSIPYGYFTWNLAYSQFDYMMLIQDLNRKFTSSGKTITIRSDLDCVLYRGKSMKTSVKTGLTVKDTKSYMEDVISDVGTRKLVLLTFGINQSIYTSFGSFFMGMSLVNGIGRLGATRDTYNLSNNNPKAQFKKVNADLTWFNTIYVHRHPVSLQSRWYAQYSYDTLYPTEKMSLGDFSSVRGYDSIQQGDAGIYCKNEFSYGITDLLSGLIGFEKASKFRVYHALDIGGIRQKAGAGVYGAAWQTTMSGFSTGVKFNDDGFNLDITISKALKASSFIEKPKYVVYLNISRGLF